MVRFRKTCMVLRPRNHHKTLKTPGLEFHPTPLSSAVYRRSRKVNRTEKKMMEPEVIREELVLPTYLPFKRIQVFDKYPKGQSKARWKHLKQILQAETLQNNLPPDEPNYVNIESPPSMHPSKKLCDVTGYEAPYYDPRTNLRYANAEVFKLIRALPDEYVQRYLALRNAAVVLK